MSSPEQLVPVNLTATAERLLWSEMGQAICLRGSPASSSLEICGLDSVGDGHAKDGLADTVYVVASGYGVLRCDDVALECTAGDVLFVPGGRVHHFERLGGEIRIWRISAVSGPANGTQD